MAPTSLDAWDGFVLVYSELRSRSKVTEESVSESESRATGSIQSAAQKVQRLKMK